MKKILTICIPTYKRPLTLRRCINSVISQVEKFGLSDRVDIFVVNDASPDDTADILNEYIPLDYFNAVNREHNLGMNINIKCMLAEVSCKSEYQLIITDDDFLQPNVLDDAVIFLSGRQEEQCKEAAIWTPRYSYTESGEIHCIVCDSFNESKFIKPTTINSSRYMLNGFVLSGLFVRASYIDFKFWETYSTNAFFPMIFVGDLLMRDGAYYWNRNIVHHTVLNKCHWESWGKNDLLIELKLLSDSLNSYRILATKVVGVFELAKFYLAACPSIVGIIRNFMASENLKQDKSIIYKAIYEQKSQGIFNVKLGLSMLMLHALMVNVIVAGLKLIANRVLSFSSRSKLKRKYYLARATHYLEFLRSTPLVFRLIF